MKKNRKPILIYILAVLVLGLFIYVVPLVTDAFEDTTVLDRGVIQMTEETDCYFVRTETVYEAGAAGSIKYNIKEGTHIKAGTILADFQANEAEGSEVMAARSKYADIIEKIGDAAIRTKSFEAQSSGVICYYADGYEATLTPASMAGYTRESIKEIDGVKAVELKQSPARKIEPVLKICDNDNWYIMCWVESASIANYEVGNGVTVTLPEGTVDMEVYSIKQDGDYWKLILWSNNYYEAFAKSRVEEGAITSRDYEGLKTETSNIISYTDKTTNEKYPVVLVQKQNGEYRIVRVKVKANDGEYSILSDVSFVDENGILHETVNIYDEILRNPDEADLESVEKAAEKAAEKAEKEAVEGEKNDN